MNRSQEELFLHSLYAAVSGREGFNALDSLTQSLSSTPASHADSTEVAEEWRSNPSVRDSVYAVAARFLASLGEAGFVVKPPSEKKTEIALKAIVVRPAHVAYDIDLRRPLSGAMT